MRKRILAMLSALTVFVTMLAPTAVSYAAPTTLEVGTEKEYKTIREAVAAAKELNPQREEEMVTINVDPGDYEEQVIFDGMKFVTLQQTPETEGRVDLHWYYCTGYSAANADLNGDYNPDIDWSLDETWNGYNDGDEQFTRYEVGQSLSGVETISYYDKNGVKHEDVQVRTGYLGSTRDYEQMAALVIKSNSTDITVRDLNIVNSVPVMVTEGEKAGRLTPEEDADLPERTALTVCAEDGNETRPEVDVFNDSNGQVDKTKYKELADKGHVFTAEESRWLVRSSAFNERGHAISVNGDRCIFEDVRVRGNQDSIYNSNGRIYFENCDLIGGTDFIYGGATAVFDTCKLGFANMTDRSYGSPLATPSTPVNRDYGYLFFNCTIYNLRDNAGVSNFGGPWGEGGQATYYNTILDDSAIVGKSPLVIEPIGWHRFGAENGKGRLYEYGTRNNSGAVVDLSDRVKNLSVEEGGTGMGTVLDEWQILEFNPRNYFAADNDSNWDEDWDPMNFGEKYLAEVDAQIEASTINVPAGEETTINLPTPSNDNIEFHWVSASTNAVVSDDETTMEVIRPALGEKPIDTSVILYARDTETGYGDKVELPVTIAATTDSENVFDMSVTINQSTNAENTYTVRITKNGALIKEQQIEVNSTTTQATVENIPANAEGIEYDIQIISASNDFTVTYPAEGRATVTGVTGRDAALTVQSDMLVDDTIDLDLTTSASDGNKTYDLIALAKENGATDSIDNSEQITIEFDVDIESALSSGNSGFIDISSGTPSNANSAVADRFTIIKINDSWHQIDAVDNTQGFSGSSNSEHQLLNITGKYQYIYPATNHLKVTIDYKASTVTIDGEDNGGTYKVDTPFTFGSFPEGAEKGTLNMGVFIGNTADKYTISNVEVTYKDLITGDDPNPEPDGIEFELPFADNFDSQTESTVVDGVTISQSGEYELFDGQVTLNNMACTNSHGLSGRGTIDIEVPGSVDVTIGTCAFDDFKAVLKDASGTIVDSEDDILGTSQANAAGDYGTYGCYSASDQNSQVVLSYSGGPTTLTLSFEKATNGGQTNARLWIPYLSIVSVDDPIVYPSPSPAPSASPSAAPTESPSVGPSETPTAAPSESPTAAPTAEPSPTVAPTAQPTSQPIGDSRIVSAYTEDGNTFVELENIESGVVVGADYGDNDILLGMETAEVSGDEIVLQGIEADKVFVWDSLSNMEPLCAAADVSKESPVQPGEEVYVDFTTMSNVPVYSAESGQGFVAQSGAIRAEGFERQVAPTDEITISSNGAAVTESDGDYLHEKENDLDGDDYNYGGLIYRVDTGAPGAYRLEVEVTGSSSDTRVAPTGMDAGRLTGTSTWDNAGNVPRTVSAKWNGSVWTYDFATGEDFVEIEIEPTSLASASDPKTVGVKSIRVIPLENNPAGDKPTIHILGDSTQKTYTFNETISAWGQTLVNYFDPDKVNVVNYSMGGRAMKSNYNEGRFDQILISGKEGDFVFIHSAHNDETVSTNRFSRGSGVETNNLKVNNASYNRWLDMYVEAIKARGMTPVLVTAMPRTGSGRYSESDVKPNGFNPDSPANMRAKAASDPEVGLVELYEGAKDYIDSLDAREVMYIYNNVEAGETPAENAANGANGDGTHYREAASKQWNRIMLQSIYDQSVAETDTYTDKDIMQELVSYMKEDVADAAESGDWSKVFPEMASDVSAVGVVPGAEKQAESNYYYRNNIEKALQLGLLHKNDDNLFKPNDTITVGEFARGIETAFGLDENSLTNYTRTYAELQAEGRTASLSEDENAKSISDSVQLSETAGDGNIAVNITQPEGGTVTVYNESAYQTLTVDIPENVTANQQLSDNEYFTLTAPSEVVNRVYSDAEGKFDSGISTNCIDVRNNGTKQPEYIAKADGILTLYLRFVDHKQITCENITDGTKAQKYMNNTEIAEKEPTEENICNAVTFNVEAGKTYEFYTNGGTGGLFGVKYSSIDYPQSTSQLMVNSGDTIRIVAEPDQYYINGAIIINGEEAEEPKECTFKVEAATTVTARFIAEPVLVEETMIATDAALTREAMGAILYDAYLAAYGKDEDGNWKKVSYMNQNGNVPSPDDPNYDPNIEYEGSPYTPLVGWGALEDVSELDLDLYQKVKEAYNLGLMRSEQGIARGSIALGNQLEPKAEVTRAKAAKTLVFAFILTQEPRGESQTLPDGINHASETAEIAVPNEDAPSTPMSLN